jgi:hypothetical protein
MKRSFPALAALVVTVGALADETGINSQIFANFRIFQTHMAPS